MSQNIVKETATFSGGCFWCTEHAFHDLPGVISVTSGYTGGHHKDPSYEEVCAGHTGHREGVQVIFDSNLNSYEHILNFFWGTINPYDPAGQFADKGYAYTTAIYYHSDEQKVIATASKQNLEKSSSQTIATEILPASTFYRAEESHQNFAQKEPIRYTYYSKHSGRQKYFAKQKLDDLQYQVTQENATEPPFDNRYWDHHEEGIYVDVVTGEALFSSIDKFDSQSGWPSFTEAITPLQELGDQSHSMNRIEVRSKKGDSHLGHLFLDGPLPSKQRYCINSAALDFVPKEQLKEQGYGNYLSLFDE